VSDFDQRLIDYSDVYIGSFPELEEWFPFRGACGVCGGVDARHRLWDTLIGMHNAGDSIESIADGYRLPVEAVEKLIEIEPYQAEIEFHNYGIPEEEW